MGWISRPARWRVGGNAVSPGGEVTCRGRLQCAPAAALLELPAPGAPPGRVQENRLPRLYSNRDVFSSFLPEEASSVLRKHRQSDQTQAGLFCGRLLWTRVPHVPAGEFGFCFACAPLAPGWGPSRAEQGLGFAPVGGSLTPYSHSSLLSLGGRGRWGRWGRGAELTVFDLIACGLAIGFFLAGTLLQRFMCTFEPVVKCT